MLCQSACNANHTHVHAVFTPPPDPLSLLSTTGQTITTSLTLDSREFTVSGTNDAAIGEKVVFALALAFDTAMDYGECSLLLDTGGADQVIRYQCTNT